MGAAAVKPVKSKPFSVCFDVAPSTRLLNLKKNTSVGWTITKRCFEQTMALKHTGSNQDKDHLYLQYANACHAVFLFQGGIQWTSGLKQHIVTPLFGPWVLSCVGISVWICPEERSKEIQVQVFLGRMLNKLNGLSILLYLVCCTFWHLLSLLAM